MNRLWSCRSPVAGRRRSPVTRKWCTCSTSGYYLLLHSSRRAVAILSENWSSSKIKRLILFILHHTLCWRWFCQGLPENALVSKSRVATHLPKSKIACLKGRHASPSQQFHPIMHRLHRCQPRASQCFCGMQPYINM